MGQRSKCRNSTVGLSGSYPEKQACEKKDEYEKCLIKMFVTRSSLSFKRFFQSTGKYLIIQYLKYCMIPGDG
jgi:hypothetical protein